MSPALPPLQALMELRGALALPDLKVQRVPLVLRGLRALRGLQVPLVRLVLLGLLVLGLLDLWVRLGLLVPLGLLDLPVLRV